MFFFFTVLGCFFQSEIVLFLLCPLLFLDKFLTNRVILLGGGVFVGGC